MVHTVIIRGDRGDNSGDLDEAPLGGSEHLLVVITPARVVEGDRDREVRQTIKTVVWIWEGGETELGFGTCEHTAAYMDRGSQTWSDNTILKYIRSTSVGTDHLEL